MKVFKKILSTLMIGAVLGAGSMIAPSNAKAGIILCPAGIGVFLIVIGILNDNLGLLILSDTDGSVSKDALRGTLMNKYQALGMSNQVAGDLASLIKDKAAATKANDEGKINVSFSAEELSQGLEASNIESDNSELFNQLVNDLK